MSDQTMSKKKIEECQKLNIFVLINAQAWHGRRWDDLIHYEVSNTTNISEITSHIARLTGMNWLNHIAQFRGPCDY